MEPPRPHPGAIDAYRRTATLAVMLVALLAVAPMAVRNLVVGEYLLGAGALAIVAQRLCPI